MSQILVIEDEESIRSEVISWLQFENYDVIWAENGQEGLALAKKHKPDLIVCDVRMPVMNGHEVLLEVRAERQLSNIPFIFVTASAEHDSIRAGMNMGADDYITKPFTLDELLDAVRVRLEKHQKQKTAVDNQIKQLQTQLDDELEAQALKTQLVAMFSHDFRNPLTLIRSSATLMIKYYERLTKERQIEKLTQIVESTQILTLMLDDMLLVAEMGSDGYQLQQEAVELTEFIQDIVSEFSDIHTQSHRFNLESTSKMTINIDPRLLRQILNNLLSNAVKYSPNGGAVHIKLIHDEDQLLLSVQDSGIGIPQEYLPDLFKPFKRAHNTRAIRGTGLGLTIIKQALDYYNGTIDVVSEIDQGSTFTIKLPLGASI